MDPGFDDFYAQMDRQTYELEQDDECTDENGQRYVDRVVRLCFQESPIPRVLRSLVPREPDRDAAFRVTSSFHPDMWDEAHPYRYTTHFPAPFNERVRVQGLQWCVPTSEETCDIHARLTITVTAGALSGFAERSIEAGLKQTYAELADRACTYATGGALEALMALSPRDDAPARGGTRIPVLRPHLRDAARAAAEFRPHLRDAAGSALRRARRITPGPHHSPLRQPPLSRRTPRASARTPRTARTPRSQLTSRSQQTQDVANSPSMAAATTRSPVGGADSEGLSGHTGSSSSHHSNAAPDNTLPHPPPPALSTARTCLTSGSSHPTRAHTEVTSSHPTRAKAYAAKRRRRIAPSSIVRHGGSDLSFLSLIGWSTSSLPANPVTAARAAARGGGEASVVAKSSAAIRMPAPPRIAGLASTPSTPASPSHTPKHSPKHSPKRSPKHPQPSPRVVV